MLVGLRLLPEELGQDTWLRKLEEDTSDLIARQGPHTGLRNALNEVRRLASAVRDRLSIDTWRILNQLHQDMRVRQGRIQFDEVLVYLNRIITDLAAFSGMEMENMTRGHGWRFLNLGRRLERSVEPHRRAARARSVSRRNRQRRRRGRIVEPLLEIADSSMTYRRRYYAQPRLAPALHLLIADDTNTRGLSFQLAAVVGAHPPPAARSGSAVADARGALDRAGAETLPRSSSLRHGPRQTSSASMGCSNRSTTTEGHVGCDHLFLFQPRRAAGELMAACHDSITMATMSRWTRRDPACLSSS